MKRLIWHWTGGAHTPSGLDLAHYHFVIRGDGEVTRGKHPVHANRAPIRGEYAAHTRGANSDAIGIAVAAMAGAVERPFNPGRHPITPAQVAALVALTRKLAGEYRIPVTRETVLSHAEVQPTLGIKQRQKWDIAWLPGMATPGDPVSVGDYLRGLVKAGVSDDPLRNAPTGPVASPPVFRPSKAAQLPPLAPPTAPSFWSRFRAMFGA